MIRMLFRFLSRSFSWTIALLTAWYRDGFVRSSERDTKAWDALDRLQRWLSVGFWVLVLSWIATPGTVVPDFGQGTDATFWIEVAMTAFLSWFVFAILARRIVVSNRHLSWGFAQMPTDLRLALFPSRPRRFVMQDGVEQEVASNESVWAAIERALRKGFGLVVVPAFVVAVPVAMLLPHFFPETAAFLNPSAVWIILVPTLTLGVVAGVAQSVGVASDATAKARMLSPVRAAFGGSDAEYQRSRFRIRGHNLYVSNAPAVVFSDLQRSDAALGGVAPDWQLSRLTDAAQRRLVLEKAHPDTVASRALLADSNGLLIGVTDEPNSIERPDAVRYLLADGVSPSRYAEVDAVLSRTVARFDDGTVRDLDPLRVVEWRPESREAIAARIPRHTAALRDAFAPYLGVNPHEIELFVSLDDEQRTERIEVLRYPRSSSNLDRLKRISQWRSMASATIQKTPGTRWIVEDRVEDGQLTLRRIEDILAKGFTLDDLHTRFPQQETDPARSWKRFPVAMREDGHPIIYTTFHTLCVGQTGAGKGSVVNGVIAGLIPAMREGFARVYAIDPKGAEAIGDDGSERSYFESVATTPDDWAVLVSDVVREMDARKGRGRKLDVREHPLILLFIDELSALSALDTDTKRRGQVMSDLLKIASQGRSLNVLILSAVQAPQKDMVGALRGFLGMRIALRTETPIETNLVLGDGSTEGGAEAHLIPIANDGNNYASAGIGYMRVEGEADPVRVRFPYVSDDDLDRWDSEFRDLRASGVLGARPTRRAQPEDVPLPDAFEGWDDNGASTDEVLNFELPSSPDSENSADDDDPFAFLVRPNSTEPTRK